jgi:hypothetical protein
MWHFIYSVKSIGSIAYFHHPWHVSDFKRAKFACGSAKSSPVNGREGVDALHGRVPCSSLHWGKLLDPASEAKSRKYAIDQLQALGSKKNRNCI